MKKIIFLSIFILLLSCISTHSSIEPTNQDNTKQPTEIKTNKENNEIKALSVEMSENIVKAKKKSVAVVDFTDLQGNITELGRFIAEGLSVSLVNAAQDFEVIDRTHLKTLIREYDLLSTGLIDAATASKVGQIAGVDALITGTITPFSDTIHLSIKIIDVNTAKLIWATNIALPKTTTIQELLEKEISTATTAAPENKPAATPTPQNIETQSIEMKGFIFELQGCKRTNDGIVISFFVTSIGLDRTLEIGGSLSKYITVYDNYGNEYYQSNIQLADKNSSFKVVKLLLADVKVLANLTFKNISPDSSVIKLCDIYCYHNSSSTGFSVQFRDIPISK